MLLIAVLLFLVFGIFPVIVGWAVLFLLHIFTGDPEITSWWTRWFVGVAIVIVGWIISPDVNVTKNVTERINHYYHDGDDVKKVE